MYSVSRLNPARNPGGVPVSIPADLEQRVRQFAATKQLSRAEAVQRLLKSGLFNLTPD